MASRSFSSEPAFTPMRMGTSRALASRAISRTLSWYLMFPGLMRSPWIPASNAAIAYFHWKWMSATTGTVDFAAIATSASASSQCGTATRTMSTPAATSEAICCSVALMSAVFVVVIDWIETGRIAADRHVADPDLPGLLPLDGHLADQSRRWVGGR